MPRFFLYYRASLQAPIADLRRIHEHPASSVVESGPAMVAIETDEANLQSLMADLPDWGVDEGSPVRLPVETAMSRAVRRRRAECSGGAEH